MTHEPSPLECPPGRVEIGRPWSFDGDGEPVAGVYLAFHGSAATYLLGWSGNQGRRSRASHYLLWHSIEYLKQLGLLGFDLGGIDASANPGIARFKLGIGGERYELVGEYCRW